MSDREQGRHRFLACPGVPRLRVKFEAQISRLYATFICSFQALAHCIGVLHTVSSFLQQVLDDGIRYVVCRSKCCLFCQGGTISVHVRVRACVRVCDLDYGY